MKRIRWKLGLTVITIVSRIEVPYTSVSAFAQNEVSAVAHGFTGAYATTYVESQSEQVPLAAKCLCPEGCS